MDILDRVVNDNIEGLGAKELAKLYDYDIFTLGECADNLRQNLYGKKVFFNMNRHINPSNICADTCKFCAFSASRKNPNPYQMSIDEILKDCESAYKRGAAEVHIVSAHNPNYSYQHYMDVFSSIKKAFPKLHIKAMGGAEVDYLTRKFKFSHEKVLQDLDNAGVDSLPGGGAEIFDEEIRKKICNGKAKSHRWFEIHKFWHSLGKMSNATMLFGHIEERHHRIDHMLRLRHAQTSMQKAQNKEGGFNAFIPLLYQKFNNFLNIEDVPTGQEILKTISIARLLLNNIPHIKAYWASITFNLAIVVQEFGADDMDGTIENESIQSAAGAKSKAGVSKEEMIYQIQDAGFVPVLRDSLYNELHTYDVNKTKEIIQARDYVKQKVLGA